MNCSHLVSVIIPAYNHEKYVAQCIRSVMDQDYPDIELLIVDDGSKDNTFPIVQGMREACEKRFSRFVCETQQNQGTCGTLNRLLAMAQGDFVYLIASDDMAKPNAVSTLLNEFQSDDVVLAVGDNEFIDAQGTRIGWGANGETEEYGHACCKTFASFLRTLDNADFGARFGEYETLLQDNYIPNGYLVRRSAWEKAGGFTREAPLEDHYLHLQLAKIGKFRFVDSVLFSYRWHGANTAMQHDKMVRSKLQTIRYEESLLRKKYPELLPVFQRHWTLASCRELENGRLAQKKYRKYRKLFNLMLALFIGFALLCAAGAVMIVFR